MRQFDDEDLFIIMMRKIEERFDMLQNEINENFKLINIRIDGIESKLKEGSRNHIMGNDEGVRHAEYSKTREEGQFQRSQRKEPMQEQTTDHQRGQRTINERINRETPLSKQAPREITRDYEDIRYK